MRIHYPGGPAGAPTLRLDQLEAIYRCVNEITDPAKSGSVLVGAGMGSGKTVVSVEVIAKVNPTRALVVGVRDSYSQWDKTFKEQRVIRPLLRINGTTDGLRNLKLLVSGFPGLFFVGLEFLRSQDWGPVSETVVTPKEINEMFGGVGELVEEITEIKQLHTFKKMKPLDLLISDEAHKHSNQKSASLKTLTEVPARSKIALSGTFFGNKFENAWSLCVWLWSKKVIGTKGLFEADFCVKVPVMSKDGKVQMKTPGGFPLSKIIGERNPGEFVETLPCYVFIATPIGDVPDAEVVKFNLSKEEQRQYDEMESKSLTWIPTTISSTREPLIADLDLTQRIRLRTAALGAMTMIPGKTEDDPDKVTFAAGEISTTLTEAYKVLHRPSWVGQKALILTHSKPFAEEMARRISQKYSVALKTGDTPPKRWDEEKARFMLDSKFPETIQYLVAVISAVGTATDGLQVNCSKVLWASEDENNVNNIQGSNRIWRQGVDLSTYEAVKLVARGTIAEGILKKNNTHKTRTLDSVAGAK